MLENFYNLVLPALELLLRVLARFIPRLQVFLRERDHWEERWRKNMAKVSTQNRVWFHVSSVGELEQVRPVMERLQQKFSYTFILSFYSPSVPRLVKDWSFVAYADYLPLDYRKDMDVLMDIVSPQMLVLNRYDLWPNLLRAARLRAVPVALLNASTPPLGFFGWISLSVRSFLFREIQFWTFVDSVAANAWEPYLQKNVQALVAGNPRVDRAFRRVDNAIQAGKTKAVLQRWEHEKQNCLVAGSTWEKDEEVLLKAFAILRSKRPKAKLILVPHEPHPEHIEKTQKLCAKKGFSVTLYSSLVLEKVETNSDILLVDARGVLAEIYGEGALAYVGGGFGREIHSVIEPLAHGLPVAFGPKHHRSPEAKTLAIMEGAYVVESPADGAELAEWWEEILLEGEKARRAKEVVRVYMNIHRGAGERVGDFLAERIKIQ